MSAPLSCTVGPAGGVAALVAALAGVPLSGGASSADVAVARGGKAVVKGDVPAAKFLAKSAAPGLLGDAGAAAGEVDAWLAFLASPAAAPGAGAGAVARAAAAALASRSFLAGYGLTLADIAVLVALRGAGAGAGAAEPPALARWRALVEPLLPLAAAAAAQAAPAAAPAAAAPVVAPAAAAAAAAAAAGSPPAGGAAAPPPPADAAPPAAPASATKAGKGGKGAGAAAAASAGASVGASAGASAAAGGDGAGADAPAGGSVAVAHAGGGGDSGALPALEGAVMGEVVTRFPPEPSGYLHIGHVKAVLLNNFYARHYKGRLIVRFDDTNPSKERDEFEQAIIADLATLGVVGDVVTHTSDYFELCQDEARRLIAEGKAFMDDTPQEQMREERGALRDSARRGEPPDANLARFEAMLKGGPEGGKWCLRAKINMQDPNGTLRDPVLYRANETPHHRTGTRFKAYPTYDFACPIVDSIEGVTHALRTSEYADRIAQYEWVQAALGVRRVRIHEFSRLNFVYTLLSKRKLAWFADNKLVEGWFDPRFPTVQGVMRRGCVLPALREFILGQGASRRVLDMEWDKFWATNKKHVDPVAPRYTALAAAGRARLALTAGDGLPAAPEARAVPLHPKNAAVGSKAVWFGRDVWLEADDAAGLKVGEEVTLMKWGNVVIREVTRDAAGAVTALRGELHLAGDFKKTEKKLTWLCANADAPAAAEPTPLILRDFDYLITVPKLEEGDDFEAAVNPRTVVEAAAVGEAALRGVGAGAIVQLERKGFYRVDVAWGGDARPAVLFAIPDGRPKTWGVNSPDDLKARQAREAAKRDAEAAAKAAAAAAAKAAKIAAKAVAPPAVPATA